MAKRRNYENRQRPDMNGITRTAKELVRSRSRYLDRTNLTQVRSAEVSSHVFESIVHQPGRRTLSRGARTFILQQAEESYAQLAEHQALTPVPVADYDS